MEDNNVFEIEKDTYNRETVSVPKPQPKTGMDTDGTFYDNIISAGLTNQLDTSEIDRFSTLSERRNQIYKMFDAMGEDSRVSAVLDTYAEDATEPSDTGRIMWCESDDADVAKLITFYLDSMNVDKNCFKWAHALCKYGDVYLRLYRESDEDDHLFNKEDIDARESVNENKKSTLTEAIKIRAYKKTDNYTHYVEMKENPAEMFELSKFGKTYGFIQADVERVTDDNSPIMYQEDYRYKFNQKDINIFEATEWVHGMLEDNSSRNPEEVTIFLSDNLEDEKKYTYKVKRGQSLLYHAFKIWRELTLLENSLMLNRVTKSSVLRVISSEVKDMPKENVIPHLQSIKNMVEQKTALNTNQSMSEYTNPAPMENTIYVSTRNGVGALTASQIGGDVDIKSIADIEYFLNALFGTLRVPKQYFGYVDDNGGFSGGQSLSIISSRYAKLVKRIQNALIQMVTDAVNLMLIDVGLDSYINKYTLKMQAPTTQEEIDRRDNTSGKVQLVSDIMNMLSDIESSVVKLTILKTLLADVVNEPEVISLIQEEIDRLEQEGATEKGATEEEDNFGGEPAGLGDGGFDRSTPMDLNDEATDFGGDIEDNEISDTEEPEKGAEETVLPSPSDLGVDFTNDNEQ